MLQWQTANLTEMQFEPVWKQMIAEFESANPGIKIEPVLVARKDHWTKFVAAAQAKKAPCFVSVDITTAAYNGYLMPLDKYWNAEPANSARLTATRSSPPRNGRASSTACRSGAAYTGRSTTAIS